MGIFLGILTFIIGLILFGVANASYFHIVINCIISFVSGILMGGALGVYLWCEYL